LSPLEALKNIDGAPLIMGSKEEDYKHLINQLTIFQGHAHLKKS
jgi:hypothetical protein